MAKIEMLKKLTAKAIMGAKIKAPEVATKLFTIFGEANDIKRGETNFGPWVALCGRFEAVKTDTETGEVTTYSSAQAFIPEPLHGMIVAAVVEAKKKEDGAVQFACDVILKPRPDLAIGYEYIAKPLMEASQADPLAQLRAMVASQTPALSAPVKTEAETATEEKANEKKAAGAKK